MRNEPSDKFKNQTDGDYSELDYETRAGFWYAWKWVGACVLAVVVLVAVLWGTGVLWAGPKGAGDAYKTNQSGSNRIASGGGNLAYEAPGDDGSYGPNEPGVFFFTTSGVMVQTDQGYVVSDQPIPVGSIDVPKLG